MFNSKYLYTIIQGAPVFYYFGEIILRWAYQNLLEWTERPYYKLDFVENVSYNFRPENRPVT